MLSVHKTTVFFFKSTSKHEKQLRGTGTGRQFVLTARTKTIERSGTGRQFPPSLASLSATKFSLQIYMELTGYESLIFGGKFRNSKWPPVKMRILTKNLKIWSINRFNYETLQIFLSDKRNV